MKRRILDLSNRGIAFSLKGSIMHRIIDLYTEDSEVNIYFARQMTILLMPPSHIYNP